MIFLNWTAYNLLLNQDKQRKNTASRHMLPALLARR